MAALINKDKKTENIEECLSKLAITADPITQLHQTHPAILEKVLLSLPLRTIQNCRKVDPGKSS
jgi:hypothetical protein